MYKRILVPLDGSPLAEAVIQHLRPFVQAFDTEIILLEVLVEPVDVFATHESPLAPSGFARRELAEVTAYLKALCLKLEQEGLRASYLVREGSVPETILDVAEFMQAEAIAMSTHGYSLTKLLLLGSVTYHVVRRSPLPVLVIRPDAVKEASKHSSTA